MNLQTVHIRINDEATGQPTPVRLRITDAAGTYYAPFGHSAEFPTGRGEAVGGDVLIGRERWAYIDGTCEIALPSGELTVEACKGPAYRTLREAVNLPAGKLALRFTIASDSPHPRALGWASTDTRAHSLPPHAALLEAAAEDLDFIFLLSQEAHLLAADGHTHATFPNLLAFSGQQTCLARNGHAVCVGTLNAHPVLGSLALLHSHRIVYPLAFGGADANDDWSLADWCAQCHRKGGLVVWVDPFDPKPGHAGEALANAIMGRIDAFELGPDSANRLRPWYHLLNSGVRLPLVGASTKASNRTPIGAFRTWAQSESDSDTNNLSSVVAAIKAGRTVASAGQLLDLRVEGFGPGDVIRRAADQGPIRASFGLHRSDPEARVELLANGQVVANSAGGSTDITFDLPYGGWVAGRCMAGGRLFAQTSPVYVEVKDMPPPIDPAALTFLDRHLQRTRDWIVTEGRFTKDKLPEHLLAVVDTARQQLLARAHGSGTIGPHHAAD